MSDPNIRLECLRPAEKWERPTGEEIREVLRLAGLTGGGAAKKVGLGQKGDRTVRRWIGEETHIPFDFLDDRPARCFFQVQSLFDLRWDFDSGV